MKLNKQVMRKLTQEQKDGLLWLQRSEKNTIDHDDFVQRGTTQ